MLHVIDSTLHRSVLLEGGASDTGRAIWTEVLAAHNTIKTCNFV